MKFEFYIIVESVSRGNGIVMILYFGSCILSSLFGLLFSENEVGSLSVIDKYSL
jgi:hypothetical protein